MLAQDMQFMINTCTDDNVGLLKPKGLNDTHAYTILQVYESIDEVGDSIKLIKVKDPNGLCKWNGDYSFDSPLWTDEL